MREICVIGWVFHSDLILSLSLQLSETKYLVVDDVFNAKFDFKHESIFFDKIRTYLDLLYI